MTQHSNLLPEFLGIIAETTHNFTIQQLPKRVILLMGSSKAGKTTLLYYLLGKKLNLITNDLGVSALQPQAIYQSAYIGNGYESTTVYPNIPPDCGVDDLIIVDMPGFDDSRPTYKLINFYILLQILKMVDQVHICQVIEQMFIDSDQFQTQMEKICAFIHQDILKTEKALSFIITKVEDQESIQKFEATLQVIMGQNQNENIIQQLQTFLKDKKYMFKYEQPKLQEGLELKQKIIEESVFVKIDKKQQNFLSPSFCDHMIGETHLEQFRKYLTELVQESESTILHLIRLFFSLIRYENCQTIAIFEDLSVQEIKSSALADIKSKKKVILINEINQIQILQGNNFQVSQQSIRKLVKILKFQHNFSLIDFMQSLAFYFQQSQTQTAFPLDIAATFYSTFKEIHMLLTIFVSINNQLKQIIARILDNPIIKDQILQFNKYWHENAQKFQAKTLLPQSTSKFFQIYCCQILSIQVKEQLVDIFSYKQIKNIEVKKLLDSPPKKQNHKQSTKIKKSSFLPKQIQSFPLNSSVLELIFQVIMDQDKNNNFLFVLLKKAAQIFTHFSLLEEAILFYMAASNHKTLSEIVQIGLHQGLNISTSFVKQILLKYLMNSNWPYHNQICICYNYLASMAQNEDQFTQSQLEFVQYLKTYSLRKTTFRENIVIKDTVELFFIEHILEQRQKYINLLKLTEKRFQESQCSAILTSPAILQIMK